MNPQESSKLIDLAGGPKSFARLLGLDQQPWAIQRVSNWRVRGIPAQVVLDHLEKIQGLKALEAA